MAIDPPDSLLNYLADGLPKQDRETLQDARAYIDTLLDDGTYRSRQTSSRMSQRSWRAIQKMPA